MPYDAFISYSHASDRKLAAAIQRGLERLGRAPYQSRALHVFRDDTSLAVSPELWGAIAKELDGATWFVLLCCPDAAESKWVGREVEHWLSTKSAQQILLVGTDGQITWDATREDFDRSSSAVPPALFGAFASEPRNLEMQWARDDEHLDLRNAHFRGAIAELAAPIHGVPNYVLYRSTAEALNRERALYLAKAGPYRDRDRHRLLAERIEGLLSQEHAQWTDSHKHEENAAAPPA